MKPKYFVNKLNDVYNNYIKRDVHVNDTTMIVIEMFDEYLHGSDIFNKVDESFKDYNFIDEVFTMLKASDYDEEFIVMILSFTIPMTGKSENRDKFVEEARILLTKKLGEGEANHVLQGF